MKEMECLISIIVPVYNSERYIGKCLDSLVKQTYKNIEIILIDDGSTDYSGEICDKYAFKDDRIKLYHTSNSGPSAARNFGLSKASGDYIMFVDSDDWIDFNTIARCYDLIKLYAGDMVIFNLGEFYQNKVRVARLLHSEYKVFSGEEIGDLKRFLIVPETITSELSVCLTGPCCKLFSRRVINGCVFPQDMKYCEDVCFMAQLLEKADKVVYTEEQLYYYRIDHNSLSHTNNGKIFAKRSLKFTNWIIDFYESGDEIAKECDRLDYDTLNEFCFKNYCEAVGRIVQDDGIKLTDKKRYIKWYLKHLKFDYNFKRINYQCQNKHLQMMRFLIYKEHFLLLWILLKMIDYKNKRNH